MKYGCFLKNRLNDEDLLVNEKLKKLKDGNVYLVVGEKEIIGNIIYYQISFNRQIIRVPKKAMVFLNGKFIFAETEGKPNINRKCEIKRLYFYYEKGISFNNKRENLLFITEEDTGLYRAINEKGTLIFILDALIKKDIKKSRIFLGLNKSRKIPIKGEEYCFFSLTNFKPEGARNTYRTLEGIFLESVNSVIKISNNLYQVIGWYNERKIRAYVNIL